MAWVTVAKVLEVRARTGTTVCANGQELALFQVDGRYYCLENVCPHMEGPLAEGDLEGETVYCPWHFWPINVRTGAVEYDPSLCAATFPCRVEDDAIWVE